MLVAVWRGGGRPPTKQKNNVMVSGVKNDHANTPPSQENDKNQEIEKQEPPKNQHIRKRKIDNLTAFFEEKLEDKEEKRQKTTPLVPQPTTKPPPHPTNKHLRNKPKFGEYIRRLSEINPDLELKKPCSKPENKLEIEEYKINLPKLKKPTLILDVKPTTPNPDLIKPSRTSQPTKPQEYRINLPPLKKPTLTLESKPTMANLEPKSTNEKPETKPIKKTIHLNPPPTKLDTKPKPKSKNTRKKPINTPENQPSIKIFTKQETPSPPPPVPNTNHQNTNTNQDQMKTKTKNRTMKPKNEKSSGTTPEKASKMDIRLFLTKKKAERLEKIKSVNNQANPRAKPEIDVRSENTIIFDKPLTPEFQGENIIGSDTRLCMMKNEGDKTLESRTDLIGRTQH